MIRAAAATVLLVILGALPARAADPNDSGQAGAGFNQAQVTAGQTPVDRSQAKFDASDAGTTASQAKPAPAKAVPNRQPAAAAKQPQPAAKQPQPAAKAASGPRPGRTRCLSQGETRETVSARKLFSPFTALRTAGAHARGETIGVRLCRHGDDLFYEINVLRRDGRVVKVILDAASGKILRSVNDR